MNECLLFLKLIKRGRNKCSYILPLLQGFKNLVGIFVLKNNTYKAKNVAENNDYTFVTCLSINQIAVNI